MIFALIGQSASGKSTVERKLAEQGYPRIISYTTRPMRNGEVNGIDYHFIDEDTFHSLADHGFFAETARYRDWYYGLSLEEIDYKSKDYIVVVTIDGYEEIVHAVGLENVTGIHIKVEERVRIIRQLYRGDDVDEVIRRINTDRIDFTMVEDVCPFTVENDDISMTVEKIINIINITKELKKVL